MARNYHGKPNYDNDGFEPSVIPALKRMNIPHRTIKVGNKTRVRVKVRLSDEEFY